MHHRLAVWWPVCQTTGFRSSVSTGSVLPGKRVTGQRCSVIIRRGRFAAEENIAGILETRRLSANLGVTSLLSQLLSSSCNTLAHSKDEEFLFYFSRAVVLQPFPDSLPRKKVLSGKTEQQFRLWAGMRTSKLVLRNYKKSTGKTW